MTVTAAPQRLLDAVAEWKKAGERLEEPILWNSDRWASIPESRGLPHGSLSRDQVTEVARKVTAGDLTSARTAFVAAMAWGYGRVGYGPSRVNRIMSQPGFDAQLSELTNVILDKGGVAGYQLVHKRRDAGDAFFKYLGSGFGTKYLYFLTKARGAEHVTPVLDSMVRRWFARHAPEADVQTGSRWGCPKRYDTYVRTLRAWAQERDLQGIAVDDLERIIFLDQKGVFGALDTAAPDAQELLLMLGDVFVDRGLEEESAEPLERLSRLLDDRDPAG